MDHDVAGVSHEFKAKRSHVAEINMKCVQEIDKLFLEQNRRTY